MISILDWAVAKGLFRNINHALWFQMSFWIFVLVIAYYFYPSLKTLILLPIAIHGVAFIQAYLATYKNHQSDALSKDCVWFNAFMASIYIFLFFFLAS